MSDIRDFPEHWKLVTLGEGDHTGYHLVRRDGVVISTFKDSFHFWGWAVIGGWPRVLRTDFWCLAEQPFEYPDPLCFLAKFDAECPLQAVEPGDEFLDETLNPWEAIPPVRVSAQASARTRYTVNDLIKKFKGEGS